MAGYSTTAGAGVNPSLMALTPAQFSQLSPADQDACLRGLSPQGQQQVKAAIAAENLMNANRRFMRQSIQKTGYCPVTGGSGVTASYVPGQTLYFDFPTVPGFATDLLINYNLAVTPATGTAAVYAVNPAAPFSIFSEMQVLYNGPQIRTHPFELYLLDVAQGMQQGAQGRVLAGLNDSTIASNLVGTTPIVTGVSNTWQGKMRLRLNPLSRDSVPGVLPVSGTGNKPQLKLTCTPGFVGLDPLFNCIAPVSGTGHSGTTVTGTINVDILYLDGTTMENITPLTLNWQSQPTIQYLWDIALTPFSGGSVIQHQTISSKLQHWYVFSVIIDGNQSSQFAQLSNITGFQFGPDQIGQQTFVNWNISNNVSIYDHYLMNVRDSLGQDLPNGVIPWVMGPTRGVTDSDNRNGIQFLNMKSGGFPAATHFYQMGSTGAQGSIAGYPAITPRVETFLIAQNDAGLRVQ